MNQFPIRTLSEMTGVATTTLRAWERRYGLLRPARTPKGHRLYSSEDVELIRKISTLLQSNHTISEAIRLLRNPDSQAEPTLAGPAQHWTDYQQRMLRAIEAFNDQNLDKVYNDALAIYPVDMVTREVIIPVLKTLGERWQERQAGIAEEHFFSAFLRNKLGARFHHETQRSRGRRILVACLPGEYHELGVMLYCIAALGHGYRILYLGTDMPFEQIAEVVSRTRVAGVLLSGSAAAEWPEQQQAGLKSALSTLAVPLMIGGEFSERFAEPIEQLGAHPLGADHMLALQTMEALVPAFPAP